MVVLKWISISSLFGLLVLMSSPVLAGDHDSSNEHESSPLYKKAIELGYKDYGWLSSLHAYYVEVGDKALRSWIILVDNDCGRYYKATQYVKPYVIYRARRSEYSLCTGREMVAVLPPDGVTVNRNEYIDQDSYYVFSGVMDATGKDGFPMKVPLLKQHKKHHQQPNK